MSSGNGNKCLRQQVTIYNKTQFGMEPDLFNLQQRLAV